MTNKYKSELTFENYYVKEMFFKINPFFVSKDQPIDLVFDCSASSETSNTNATVILQCKLFDENSESDKYPYFLSIEVVGTFGIEMEPDEDSAKRLLEMNSVAILFPYLRSMITNITASSGVPPVILPPINVYKLMKNYSEN